MLAAVTAVLALSSAAPASAAGQVATLLVDNGSRRAASTLALRQTARSLSLLLGTSVEPVSLRWSDGVPAEELGGEPARTLGPALRALAAQGVDSVAIVPLFLGPSDGLRTALEAARQDPAAPAHLALGSCLVDEATPDDVRVGRAVTTGILRTARAHKLPRPYRIALVDHGTTSRPVNAVRSRLTRTVRSLLGSRALAVEEVSMERRDGAEFDFNDPLLARLVGARPPFDAGDVIVAMAFLQPGRHAGEGGDVAQILDEARRGCPGLRTHVTPLLGGSTLVHQVLRDRATEAQRALLNRGLACAAS
jgi:sirohydrochlorin ferrochelatase